MTEARREASDSPVLREVIRRAGHEIRNALSGVAVNLEVVRSRVSRDQASADVLSFADRARLQVQAATTLTNGLLAVVAAAVAGSGAAAGKAGRQPTAGGELALKADLSANLADVEQLASAIGVSIEQRGGNVILKVLPEGQSHSKD